MLHEQSESNIVRKSVRTFLATELVERANEAALFERKREFEVVPFFWTLVFGFVAGNDRSVQALRQQFLAPADDVASPAYTSLSNLFTPFSYWNSFET